MRYKSSFRAFTLVELIVVIWILSILWTLGFISYTSHTSKVRDAARAADINNIGKTVALYKAERAKYPIPTNGINITYSWAVVWTQWVFWKDSQRETGKIFGDLSDPKYWNQYTYSTTVSQKEYQLSAVFEHEENASWIVASSSNHNIISFTPSVLPQAHAADPFTPDELSPAIWLDATDVDGDGDTGDNPANNTTVTTWVNKSSAGSANNPTVTTGNIKYSTSGFYSSYPAIFIPTSAWVRFDNSDITQGDIFQVIQKNDPFGGTDSNGKWLQSTVSSNYAIGHWNKYRDALRITSSPSHYNSSPATQSSRTSPFVYGFHTDDVNYSFYDTWNLISQWATNSVTWQVWWINRAWQMNGYADFVISEFLVFDTKLSASDRQKVEWYLAHKWWQEWYLPGSHPYKDAPPESEGPPPPPDSTPDAFTLTNVTDAALSTQYTSNSVVITGINTSATVSITDGEYSINGGAFTSATGSVSNNDNIVVRITSSSGSNTAVTATLDVGWVNEWYVVTTIVADQTPDSFVLNTVSDADVSTVYTSNTVTISWLNVSVPISISGADASYKISDGIPTDATWAGTATASSTYSSNSPSHAFDNNTSSNGWGNNNSLPAWLKYDFGSWNDQVITKYTLYRSSSQSGGWNSWKYSPSNWTFEGSNDNSNWTVLDTRTNESISVNATKKEYSFSNTQYYRYYRINISAADHSNDWVNITEMEMITDNSGTFTTTPWTVSNDDVVSVKMTSSASAGTTVTGSLTVGTYTEDFLITTVAPDTVPDSFNFSDVTDASLSTVYTSNSVTISGINSPASISISGAWEYRINGGSYTTSAGTVNNSDVVDIRQTSSASNSVTVSSTLNVWGIQATYNVTTPAPPPDTTPDAFSFVDVTDALLSTDYTSNTITVSWINTWTPISISWGQYDINGSKSYTASAGTVNNGDTISVLVTSHASPSNTVDATLTIGGVADTYSVTTIPADSTPDSFTISDITNALIDNTYVSDPVTVSGINVPIAVSISWGGWEYSINGWSYTTSAGTVNNGDVVRVRLDAPSSWVSSTSTTLTIGSENDLFSITTWVGDTTPDSFSFNDVTDASLNTQYISDTITITGMNAPATISIVWGEYRIWSVGSFTSFAGTINNGEEVTVRLVSSSAGSTTTNAALTVGTYSDTYSVTTQWAATSNNTTSSVASSAVYVTGEYNGLITHAYSGSTHYIIATPSIIAYDVSSSTDVTDIIRDKKLVYNGFDNIPASYSWSNLTMSGGFDFNITSPLLYVWDRSDLWSYGWLKQIDEWIRSTYNNFPAYQDVATYLDDYSLWYLENIVGKNIWINPIKPFYCSDILRSKLINNIAPDATIIASPSGFNSFWTGWIANGITSTEGELDYEYHSADGNATISFEWEKTQKVWYVRIYNRTWCCSDRLTGANIKLYNNVGWIIYSHPLWDTTGDYVVDLDLEGINQLHEVKKLTIESVAGNYLNLREVEIFLWWNVVDGVYKVDKDGLWGASPYNVYCDMTTDGGWWTRIGENYIWNGEFRWQNHVDEHTFTGYDSPSDNLIVSHVTQAPPEAIPDAFAVQHNGSSSESYPIYIPTIPWEYFAQEIRLTAWVKDTTSSIFYNTVNYSDSSSSTEHTDFEILETQGDWQKQMARIPLTGLVEDFTWDLWESVSWPFYFTGLEMEVYYR